MLGYEKTVSHTYFGTVQLTGGVITILVLNYAYEDGVWSGSVTGDTTAIDLTALDFPAPEEETPEEEPAE